MAHQPRSQRLRRHWVDCDGDPGNDFRIGENERSPAVRLRQMLLRASAIIS